MIYEKRECSVRIVEDTKEEVVVNKPASVPTSTDLGRTETKFVKYDLTDTSSTTFSLTINSTF